MVPYSVLPYPQERILRLSQIVSAHRAVLTTEMEETQSDVGSVIHCPYIVCHNDLCLFPVRVPGLVHDIHDCRARVPGHHLFGAIRAGASGYLLKDIPLDEVADVVRAVHGGQSLINPSMAAKLLTEFAALAKRDGEEPPEQQVPAPKLTDREMQVLKLVAKGMNNRDIAKELFISENTVKNHVRNILEKLQIHSRMEAVMIAVREKLIEFS